MTTIKLPPLPEDDIMQYNPNGKDYAYGHSYTQLCARDLEVARVVLEAAANYVETNSAHMTQGQSASILQANAEGIRALEVKHGG